MSENITDPIDAKTMKELATPVPAEIVAAVQVLNKKIRWTGEYKPLVEGLQGRTPDHVHFLTVLGPDGAAFVNSAGKVKVDPIRSDALFKTFVTMGAIRTKKACEIAGRPDLLKEDFLKAYETLLSSYKANNRTPEDETRIMQDAQKIVDSFRESERLYKQTEELLKQEDREAAEKAKPAPEKKPDGQGAQLSPILLEGISPEDLKLIASLTGDAGDKGSAQGLAPKAVEKVAGGIKKS